MNIQPFDFQGHEVRVLVEDGAPRWVASDVAKVLGYRMASDMTRRLDEDEKGTRSVRTPGGEQEVSTITESGLYSAILGSKIPAAREFKRWVTHEVLPSIRKRGGYLTPEATEAALTDPDFIIRLTTSLKDERARRAELEAQAEADRPKVLFADAVSTSKSHILVGDLAKILRGNGIQVGGTRLFKWLRENGFLINRKGTDWNMPTQRSMELGLFKVKETTVVHSDGHTSLSKTSKVTGKGQEYFIARFMDGRFQIEEAA
ncbi:antirepressor [Corynebacterium sp. NML140438]|uniref:phage antirepressor n=1 Tax=Corynebacterium sp. NML140438 TaxID=1906334 RepID=UPI0008FB227E|nr:phage antirepressor KilAC domain-containing protein [Corynebacterium sp. NML140438]OIR41184.1 antirepressor [Corynebacterium sp. NML140438]